jgi:restriction system protein
MPAWHDYQEDAAALFRELGFDARTNVTMAGARGKHDIDVLATFDQAGLTVTWIIECKHWERRVSKQHVLTLRSVVEDVGADRGILLSESGFQSGAITVVQQSNVHLNSIQNLKSDAQAAIVRQQLLNLPKRIAAAHARYWGLPKSHREEHGLRPEGAALGYSGAVVLGQLKEVLFSALADQYPPRGDLLPNLDILGPEAVLPWIYPQLEDLEQRLDAAELDLRSSL